VKNPLHHINRISLPARNTFGWQVRFKGRGKNKSKYFADNWFQTSADSLSAAIKYRDKFVK
jgi:hypothetical protein